jgi:hypothetical protein
VTLARGVWVRAFAAATVPAHDDPSGYGHVARRARDRPDHRGAKDFDVRQTAIGILRRRDVRPKDYLGEIKALFEWVQRHVRYTRDPFRVGAAFGTAHAGAPAGDCDDMSILLGGMLEISAIPCGWWSRVESRHARRLHHIYIEVLCPGRWITGRNDAYPWDGRRAPVRKVITRQGAGGTMGEAAGTRLYPVPSVHTGAWSGCVIGA